MVVNAMFLNVCGAGQTHNESRDRGWDEDAGLGGKARTLLAGGYSIMRGKRR